MLTLAVALSVVCCTTTVRKHPGFQTRIERIGRLGIMPPDTSIVRVSFRGDNERLRSEEAAVRQSLPRILAEEFSERGFDAVPVKLDEQSFDRSPELRFEAALAQDLAKTAFSEMYETPKMEIEQAEHQHQTLGPEVNRFADLAGVDGLVFVRLLGFRKTPAEFARSLWIAALLGPWPVARGATLYVSIADGTNGDLLWANTFEIHSDYGRAGLERLVEGALHELER